MTYLALLRGINVGGNKKVEMKRLKTTFEQAGMTAVSTYINSGNVIFQHTSQNHTALAEILEKACAAEFGFTIKIIVIDLNKMTKVIKALPESWKNDTEMKCDVLFLWEAVDSKNILEQLSFDPSMETVKYIPGVVFWCIDRKNITKSGMLKLVGTKLYSQMTIRNCNTVRKLFTLMSQSP